MKNTPKAKSTGTLTIGGWVVPCFVLEDERRVIAQSSFFEIVELEGRGTKLQKQVSQFLDHPAIGGKEVAHSLSNPIRLLDEKGIPRYGYEGELLVDYCNVLIKARQIGLFDGEPGRTYARAAENVLLSISKVGIVALIDEATGFQSIRREDALQKILEKYLRKELAAWAKRFPDDFYTEMYRLKGWEWKGRGVNPPSVVGHYTKDIIYSRLAPGLIEELEERNPSDEKGNRENRHHQWLTDETGHPALSQHLYAVIAFMRVSSDWDSFYMKVEKAFPRVGDNLWLDMDFDPDQA